MSALVAKDKFAAGRASRPRCEVRPARGTFGEEFHFDPKRARRLPIPSMGRLAFMAATIEMRR
jgi:hypothetical protein